MSTDSTNTIPVRTLYLRNLPARPKSKQNFTRLLLKSINSSNKYVQDPLLPLPNNTTELVLNDIELLDDKNKIISVSTSRSKRLENQCFVTFKDETSTDEFLKKFNSKLTVNGRQIDIKYAMKDSFLAMAVNEDKPTLYNKLMKRRKTKKELNINPEFDKVRKLTRHVRRLRCKLKKKGIEESEIVTIIEEYKKEKTQDSLHNIKEKSKIKVKTDISKIPHVKETNNNSKVIDNPPTKRLLVQNLVENVAEDDLKTLFQGDGLLSVRLLAVRNLAFIEYNSVENATKVKDSLGDTYNWMDKSIYISFAK